MKAVLSGEPNLKVYWLPGCSSCVKVKEHLKKLNVPFESVNVAEKPQSMEELLAIGVRSVPVVTRGHEYVFAQSLDAVTEFVGKRHAGGAVQDPEFFFRKWIFLLNTALSYLEAVPEAVLKKEVIKERERPIGELIYHIFQIPAAFVHCMKNDDPDWLFLSSGPADMEVALSKISLAAYAKKACSDLEHYWNNGASEFRSKPMTLDKDLKTSMELLDRSSWHSAQHLRQVVSALVREGVQLSPAWDESFYRGLNVPDQLWE